MLKASEVLGWVVTAGLAALGVPLAQRLRRPCGWGTHGGTFANGTLVVTCHWCRLALSYHRMGRGAQRYRIDALMGDDQA